MSTYGRKRQETQPPPKKKLKPWAIALIIIGSIVLLAVIIIIIVLLTRKSATQTPSGPCTSGQDCPPGWFCINGKCAECQTNSDCSGNSSRKFCETTRGVCVVCMIDADCPTVTPYCRGNAACVMCTTNSQCPAGKVCNSSGNCITL